MRIAALFAFTLGTRGALGFSNSPVLRRSSSSSRHRATQIAFCPDHASARPAEATTAATTTTRLQAVSPSSLNEFSRTVDPERLRSSRRDYAMELVATEKECQELASRFDLPALHSLAATVSLRPEGTRTGDDGIHVQGTITASVTRTCVRTSQDFRLDDLEIPLESVVVRPVMPLSSILSLEQATMSNKENNDGKKNKKPRKTSYRPQDRNLDEMDVLQLQRMLQQDISADDDSLMEDEAIYATGGVIDVGELVAQLFWLSLDPYPKKPGTDFVQVSISG